MPSAFTITRTVTATAGYSLLDELTWQVPFGLTDAVLEETRRRERRLSAVLGTEGPGPIGCLGMWLAGPVLPW